MEATQPLFAEQQRLAPWTKVLALITAVIPLAVAVAAFAAGRPAAGLVALVLLIVVFGPLVALHLTLRLDTTVDRTGVHLRIRPGRGSTLPRRMTSKDIAVGDIQSVAVSTYDSLRSREFWGWHVWGLATNRRDRFMYVMQPSGPFRGKGVRLDVSGGEVVFVGSSDPDGLATAIRRLG